MTRFKQIVPLHTHSSYSLMDSVTSPEQWIIFCAKNEIPAIAITDHGTLIALHDILSAKSIVNKHNKKNNTNLPSVVGIPACEFYVRREAVEDEKKKHHYHLNVYATSQEGLKKLCHHGSEAWKDQISFWGNVKPRVQWNDLKNDREGLRFGSACLGSFIGIEWNESPERGEIAFQKFINDFGTDSFIEFISSDITHDWDKDAKLHKPIDPQDHYPDGNKQAGYNRFLYKMMKKYGGTPIPTLDAHFIYAEDKVLQDILLKNGLDNGWYFHDSAHYKDPEEMFEILSRHIPDLTEDEFKVWIDNTYQMIDSCKEIKVDTSYKLPTIVFDSDIDCLDISYDEKLKKQLVKKVTEHKRWNKDPEYVKRFKNEVEVISNSVDKDGNKINFIPYFLLYEEIGSIARQTGTLQNLGRGSAGGSLVAFYLKITHIDPIQTNLPFERFLSKARIHSGSFPDIDADFGNRKPIIDYLEKKYDIGFSQIATYQTIKASSALKGIMKAFYGKQNNDAELNLVTKSFSNHNGINDKDWLFGHTDKDGVFVEGEFKSNKLLNDYLETYPDVLSVLERLLGIPKAIGRHASAYIVSTVNLTDEGIPLAYLKTSKGVFVKTTQFDAPKIEERGLIKADILGLTTICVLDECMSRLKQTSGIDYLEEDERGVALVYRLPEESAVFEDICKADTLSVFQLGTPTTEKYLTQFRPISKEMISDFTALIRPGALDAIVCNSEVTEEEKLSAAQYYIDVRNGVRKLAYIHPDLEPYQTRGVFVYQEQIMALFVGLAGYSLEESDQIRTAIAKKKKDKMEEALTRLRTNLESKGWNRDQTTALEKQIESFAKYSFNRAHSRCYGEMGYITAYMKHFHPLEWWASVLTSKTKPEDVRQIVEYLAPKGIISSVSLKRSSNEWDIKDGKIFAPWHSVFKIGKTVSDNIEKCKPFNTLKELSESAKEKGLKINVGHLASLGLAGAFEADELFDIVPKSKSKAVEKLKEESKTAARRYLSRRQYDLMFHISSANSYLLKDLVNNDNLNVTYAKKDGIEIPVYFYQHKSSIYYVKPCGGLEKTKEGTYSCFIGIISNIFPEKRGITKTGKEWVKQSFELDGGDTRIVISTWGDIELPTLNSFCYVLGKATFSTFWNKNEIQVHHVEEIVDALNAEDFYEEKDKSKSED